MPTVTLRAKGDSLKKLFELLDQIPEVEVIENAIYLSRYDIEIQTPDELILNSFDISPILACKAFNEMVKRLKNPKKTKDEVLNTLENCGLKKSIEKLKNNW